MANIATLGELRIGVTSRGQSPMSEICEQFGRAYWILIYCPIEYRWQAIDNGPNRTRSHDAGIATAETLITAGVKVVLTGETGPKAFRTLNTAGILVVHNVRGVVEEAMRDWLSGRLQLATTANDPGSPNCLLGQYLTRRSKENPLKHP